MFIFFSSKYVNKDVVSSRDALARLPAAQGYENNNTTNPRISQEKSPAGYSSDSFFAMLLRL
jgi:hypothetical protein